MFFLAALLTLLAGSFPSVSADPEYEKARQLMNIHARKDDLSFCFGRNSICAVSNDLHADCSESDNGDSLIPWYECICGNGYVAVHEACYWCQQVYHLDTGYAEDIYTSGCSSAGVTIAPIPSSVLALQSSYNSTYTGVISGADAENTGSPIASASITDEESPATSTGGKTSAMGATKTPRPSSSLDDSAPSKTTSGSNTWFGGETIVVTINGGGGDENGQSTTDSPIGKSTAKPSSTLRAGGDSSGAAQDLNIGAAVAFSVAAFGLGVSVLYLM